MNNRLAWADNAKALGIFLVFLGHFIERPGFAGNEVLLQVYRHIYAFHMPFFFILTGFFYRQKPVAFGKLFLEKTRTRLLPVVFFVAIALPFWMRPDLWEITNTSPDMELQKTWLLLQGKPTANWPCWFLVCLFSIELIASELIPLLDNALKRTLVVPVLYAIGWFATDQLAYKGNLLGIAENWWFIQEAMMGLFFYVCGHWLAIYGAGLLPDSRRWRSGALAVTGLVLLLISQPFLFPDNRSSINMSVGAHGAWYAFPFTACAGSFMLIHLSGLLPDNRCLRFIGQHTLPLIGLCGLFLMFFNPLLWHLLRDIPNEWLVLAGSVLLAAMSLLVCLPAVALFDRYVPFLIGGRWR